MSEHYVTNDARRIADAIERRCAEVYPEDVFLVPSPEACAEMHAIMRGARGHGLDGFGAHAMRFAHRAIAEELRRDGLERWRDATEERERMRVGGSPGGEHVAATDRTPVRMHPDTPLSDAREAEPMSDQWDDAVRHRRMASARWAYPHDLSSVRAEGRVIGYSATPMVLIETAGGERLWWRADLTLITEDDE